MVAKPEWGKRHVCMQCNAHFYDLQKHPILCPKCGVEFDPESILKRRAKVAPGGQSEELALDGIDIESMGGALGLVEEQADREDVLEDADDLSSGVVDDVTAVRSDFDDETE
ncbi:MAG: TIGR02300 family protein [Holosporales bacterium]|jgi:uncharacterized protein (TIGR02300 family)|nr:TIGR02300 family protein [Holosporales bacterium]